jgi:hypothetical protein
MTAVDGRQIPPSPRGWTSPDRDPHANPDLRSSAACWHRPDLARNRKAFATHRAGRNARLDDPFEHTTETSPTRKRSLRARENAE